jgi:excisionase family DNA binding protein
MSKLLTVKEIAERTGLAPWRLYELFEKGQGPACLRVGRTIRVPEKALDQWVEEEIQREAVKLAKKQAGKGKEFDKPTP